jgi:uncharacterized protein (UPF0210 family)
MEIRSITCLAEQRWPLDEEFIARVGTFVRVAQESFAQAGLRVQTARLATQPFPHVLRKRTPHMAVELATRLESLCHAHSLDYCSLGPVLPDQLGLDAQRWIEAIPDVIEATDGIFTSVQVATQRQGIIPVAIEHTARAIKAISERTKQGFGNLRFAALVNCPPGSPFFPVAYHGGGPPVVAVATEAADLAVAAFGEARDWSNGRSRLIEAIESCARRISAVAETLAIEHNFRFGGIDFSLAPFPEPEKSIGEAIERLTGECFGDQSTLFAIATLTDCLRSARFQRCGFSQVMLPVLEDAVLAGRSIEGNFDLNSLLLYSAVCGTGLDTIPLPGDVTESQLAAIILDVATLAVTLNKPLTARLMPIPGMAGGELADFGFAYFAPGRILEPHGLSEGNLPERLEGCYPFASLQ